jgi:hypothetical protein
MQKCAFVSRNYVRPTDLAISKLSKKFLSSASAGLDVCQFSLNELSKFKIMRPGDAFVCSFDNGVTSTATISGTITI